MRTWTTERWAAAAGGAFVVLTLVGTFASGTSYPKVDDPPAAILTYFNDHHRAIAIGAILTGLATPLLIWLFAGLAGVLRAAGENAVAWTLLGVAVAGTALAAASDAVAQVIPHVSDAGAAQAAFATQGYLVTKAFWCAAIGAAVVGIAASRGALPRWFGWLSLAEAAVFALGGVTVKGSGFFAAGGTMALLAFLALLVWVLAAAAVLWLLPARAELPAAAATPA